MTEFSLSAESRSVTGKGASRRLRRLDGTIPGIIYGGKKEPEMITMSHKDLAYALQNEAYYSHVISLSVDGNTQDVILKDLQRHPAKSLILHVDFQRVDKDSKLSTRVPLHFINEEKAVGVKTQGGVMTKSVSELEISCLPADLPEFIEVDVAAMEMDDVLHISDIKLPKGVESVDLHHGADHDHAVVSIHKVRGSVSEEESSDSEGEGEDA